MNTPANVSEICPLIDTVIVSQQLWGNEIKVKGWFGGHSGDPWARPFEQFAATPEHLFFKERTEGNSDAAYCNLQSAETMDYAYRLYSIGVRFWGPISGFESAPLIAYNGKGMLPWGTLQLDDPYVLSSVMQHIWKVELPMHMGFEFKIEQDVILEGPAMTFPPGHGFVGSGSAWNGPVGPGESLMIDELATPDFPWNLNTTPTPEAGEDSLVQHPQMISVVNQGNPLLGNRLNFVNSKGEPQPIGIPKGALIQAKLKMTPYASYLLSDVMGPLYYLFNRRCPRAWVDGTLVEESPIVQKDDNVWFGTRYGITVSLLGERLVQQRGQYWYGPAAAEEG
jgi:hypothetical protein